MRLLTGIVILLTVQGLAGCTPEPPEPLRVGTNLWAGYEPLYLARDLGYLHGQPVKLVEYPSATEVIRAYRNGVLEAAALTLDEVLMLVDRGMAPRVVLVMDVSHGSDAIVGRAELRGLEDLRGRRVGAENTALGAYVLSRALELAGLSPADIELVPLGIHEHVAAFEAGRVDAVVTFDPERSRLLAAGARQLFDSSQIPGEIVDVLAVRPEVLARRGEALRGLLKAWFRALDYLSTRREDALRRMVARQGVAPSALDKALQGMVIPTPAQNLAMLGGESPALASTARRLTAVMRERGLLAGPVDTTQLLAPGPLEGSRW